MHSQPFRKSRVRAGIATTEIAVILPLLLLLTSATLDICNSLFMRQKMVLAAQEGARVAVGVDNSLSNIHEAVDEYMAGRGLVYGRIDQVVSVTSGYESLSVMSPITVSVTVSGPENNSSKLPFSITDLFLDEVTVGVTMLKER